MSYIAGQLQEHRNPSDGCYSRGFAIMLVIVISEIPVNALKDGTCVLYGHMKLSFHKFSS
jgi:hypothetical protein